MSSNITEKSNNWVKKNPILYLIICLMSIPIGLYFGNTLYDNLSGKKIEGSIIGNSYVGSTSVSLNSGESIMLGQGSKYEYIIKHVWKVVKKNPNIFKVDINFIIKGDDGYGNNKTSNWCHLIFEEYEINLLRKYNDLGSMTWSEKSNLLDQVGMFKLKDYKGDLSKDVFN